MNSTRSNLPSEIHFPLHGQDMYMTHCLGHAAPHIPLCPARWFPRASVLVEQIKSFKSSFQKHLLNVQIPPPRAKGKTQGRFGLSPATVIQWSVLEFDLNPVIGEESSWETHPVVGTAGTNVVWLATRIEKWHTHNNNFRYSIFPSNKIVRS